MNQKVFTFDRFIAKSQMQSRFGGLMSNRPVQFALIAGLKGQLPSFTVWLQAE
tara:strand:- start:2743 stop:2901 length:159 start_codon:yes stop_codon:yes gene_type:complete